MTRTIISLEAEDKAWLDEQARREGVPMTELVRRAVRLLRDRVEGDATTLEQSLAETAGVRSGPDGLEVQEQLRGEW